MPASVSRRSFLSSSGLGLVSLASLSALPAVAFGTGVPRIPQAPDPVGGKTGPKEKLPAFHSPVEQKGEKLPGLPPDQRIGFALVGLGKLTVDELLPAFAQSRLCKPVALVSGDREKAGRIARQYGIPEKGLYSYKDFDRIAENPDVQVIYIVLPNSMHKEYTLRAAKAGKHVLCEKPMAVNAAEAEEMVQACANAKVKLMVAYRQQYEPNNRIIRTMIADKTFGRIKLFDGVITQNQDGSTREGINQWRHKKALAGGGALPDIGLYCLNGVRYLTGEEPEEVFGTMNSTPGDTRFKEVEENFVWQMRFPSGLIASCQTAYGAYTNKYFRFSAENGWFGMDPAYKYNGNKLMVASADGNVENRATPAIAEVNQFAAEMDHMADCVRNKKAPMSPGEEGLQDHRIMDALYESARSRKPVSLKRYDKLDVFRNPKSLV